MKLRFFAIIALFLLALSVEAAGDSENASGPRPKHALAKIDFETFAKDSESQDDSVEFRSPIAKKLWQMIILHRGVAQSDEYARQIKIGGDFKSLGGGCFLVQYDALYYLCPDRNKIDQLTPSDISGSISPLDFLELPDGKSWALVEISNMNHGNGYSYFGALILYTNEHGEGVAKTTPLESVMQYSNDGDRSILCGQDESEQVPDDLVSSEVLSQKVSKDAKGYATKISFIILQQNCKTKKQSKRKDYFVFSGAHFVKSPKTRWHPEHDLDRQRQHHGHR